MIENVNFENATFEDLADFNKTCFNEINFYKTTFKDISVFTETIFNKEVDFKHTTFEKLSIFRNSKFIDSINLKDAIFKEKANFLEIKTDVSNRETARIIKDSFEQQNNIIEANKFYALEMKEREKELEEDLKNGKNFFEWLVFKIHGISSNHSQDWLLALFWILNITFSLLTTQESIKIFGNSLVAYIPIITMIVLGVITSKIHDKKSLTIFLFLITFLNFGVFKIISKEHSLDCISQKINPFSIMTELSNIDFVTFVYKIIIAYLIYQLIISIRQNTRRK